jgi:hypothetical protein
VRPEEGQVSISLVKYRPVRRDVRMTHSMGIVLPTQPENVLSETSAGKRMGRLRAQNMATTRSRKMRKKSKVEEVLSDKLSQITRSARVLQSPSCLGDGRLEVYRSGGGKRRVWERAVGRKAIILQTAGPWKVNGSCLCPDHAISSHDWTTDERCRRRGWLHPGPSHAPKET